MLLRSGKTCTDAVRLLDQIAQGDLNDARNGIPRIGSPGFPQLMQAAVTRYEDCTARVIIKLRENFVDLTLANRVRGEKYWLIVASDATSPRTASLMHTELGELSLEFMYAANELRKLQARFAGRVGRCLVVDTNNLLHYQRFDNIPWSTLFRQGAWVVLPHVVLDEIDRKSYEEGSKVRDRARGVYRMLDGLITRIDDQGYATLNDGSACLILLDEPGHRRLPNNDDEIVARAGFLQQALAPGQVTMVTRDIGMRARALALQLRAERLPDNYLITGSGLTAAALDANLALLDKDVF